MKKQFLILFAFISVLAFGQVPQRFNKVIVTGDITSQKFIKTGSNADSVLLGNGLARAISTIKTDTVSLSNRINAKAAGNGTANGTNTGDETLTSIKTKLGAASSVSDGYLTYNMFNIFNGKEPSFTKNSGFNLPLGNTPGTVLEGRTFGTAANSSVGDFVQINPSSAQSGSLWISGTNRSSIQILGTNATATGYLSRWGNGTNEGFLDLQSGGAIIGSSTGYLQLYSSGGLALQLNIDKSATFASTVTASSFSGSGSNLTGVQKPITLTTNGTSGAATFSGNVLNVPNYAASGGVNQTQTTVNGSTSGNMVCSMPFQTGSYKKVIIYLTNLVGTAEYIFPVQFVGGASKRIITTNVTVGTSGSFPDDRVNITATSGNGTITIEGY